MQPRCRLREEPPSREHPIPRFITVTFGMFTAFGKVRIQSAKLLTLWRAALEELIAVDCEDDGISKSLAASGDLARKGEAVRD